MNDLTNFSPNWKRKDWFYLALACLAAYFAVLPIQIYGVPLGSDMGQHYQFAITFYDAISQGNFFPSWAAKANYGFGSVGIRFYPPLGYYVMALFRFLAGNWYEASWLAFSFWMMLGNVGVFLFIRDWRDDKEALFAAAVYSVMPTRLMEIYMHFLYGEFVGAAVLPFCFVFATRVVRRGQTKDIFWLAFAYAMLILSHIPTTIIGSLSLAIYVLAILERKRIKSTLVKLSFAVLFAGAGTSFYWLRVMTEVSWVNSVKEEFSTGWYGYQNQFLPYILNYSSDEYARLRVWQMDAFGLATLLLMMPLLLIFIYDKLRCREQDFFSSKIWRGVFLTGFISLLMATSLSSFIWDNIGFLQRLQFPWRWLIVTNFIAAVALSAAIFRIWNNGKPNRFVAYPFLALLFCITLFNLTQVVAPTASAPFSRERFYQATDPLLNAGSFECWWTVWSKKEALQNRNKVSSGERAVEIQTWADEQRIFTIESGSATMARIATFWYPHWHATVNEQAVEIQRHADGTMLIPLPAEKADVKLIFREPFQAHVAAFISLLAWITIFMGVLTGSYSIYSHRIFRFQDNKILIEKI